MARGPYQGNSAAGTASVSDYREALNNLATRLRETFQYVDSLSRGRVADGINRMIENFLVELNADPGQDVLELESYRRLHTALVRFSQKLLFLANSDSLFAPPSEGLRWLVTQANKKLNPFAGDASVEAGVRVLQSIGWSILVQADELRQYRDHEQRLRRSKSAEVHAVVNATKLIPSVAMEGVVEEARRLVQLAETKLEQASQRVARLEMAKEAGRADIHVLEQAHNALPKVDQLDEVDDLRESTMERVAQVVASLEALLEGTQDGAAAIQQLGDLSKSSKGSDLVGALAVALSKESSKRGLELLQSRTSERDVAPLQSLLADLRTDAKTARDEAEGIAKHLEREGELRDKQLLLEKQLEEATKSIPQLKAEEKRAKAGATILEGVRHDVVAAMTAGRPASSDQPDSVSIALAERRKASAKKQKEQDTNSKEKNKKLREQRTKAERELTEAKVALEEAMDEAYVLTHELMAVDARLESLKNLKRLLSDREVIANARTYSEILARLELRREECVPLLSTFEQRLQVEDNKIRGRRSAAEVVEGEIQALKAVVLARDAMHARRRALEALPPAPSTAASSSSAQPSITELAEKAGWANFTTPTDDEFRYVLASALEPKRGQGGLRFRA